MIDILIPTLDRPGRIPILCESLLKHTVNSYRLFLMVEPKDTESISVAIQHDCSIITGNFGSYENAMNTGYFLTNSEYIFLGVDDIEFTPSWDVTPQLVLKNNPNLSVIGHRTIGRDCPPDGIYSCHFTVRRSYVRENTLVHGMPNLIFYPYYHHECDRELFWYARNQGIFQSCPESTILNDQQYDATRQKTTSKDGIDRDTYWNRRHLFRGA